MARITRNDNQRELMAMVFECFEAGKPATVGKLRKAIAPDITPPAFACRLRFLIKQGMIVRIHPGSNIFEIHPTRKGYDWFRHL